MAISAERMAHKAAIAEKDWTTAAQIKRDNPEIFGAPPPGVSDEIAAIVNDPSEPAYMVVEWRIQKNDCQGSSGCRPYSVSANQFDHLPAGKTEAEVTAWFERYVQNRATMGPAKDQLGSTLYLLKVERIELMTDFDGNPR